MSPRDPRGPLTRLPGRIGTGLLVGIGGAFTAWWVNLSMSRPGGSLVGTLLSLLPMSGLIVVAG